MLERLAGFPISEIIRADQFDSLSIGSVMYKSKKRAVLNGASTEEGAGIEKKFFGVREFDAGVGILLFEQGMFGIPRDKHRKTRLGYSREATCQIGILSHIENKNISSCGSTILHKWSVVFLFLNYTKKRILWRGR